MKIKFVVLCLMLFVSASTICAQDAETRWVDSVYHSLTLEQRVAQLICMRANNPDQPFFDNVGKYITKYNIGGVCFFRADATAQVEKTNEWQALAQTPLMVSIDAEWGLGMRVKNTLSYPYQMTLGAVANNQLIYQMGEQVAEQCQRMGIHVNFAPVVDVNSNPANPIIGMRSFGERPQMVAEKGVAYAQGMQSKGLITSMKHFPGHGNTATDSHMTLPTVNRTLDEVRDIELAPFRYMIENGVNGAMVGHLYFPAIEKVANTSSSLSYGVVTGLLKQQMGFEGLIFTDGLDMKGVSQVIDSKDVPFEALMAGNDVLILPTDVPYAIKSILKAAEKDATVMARVEESCKKILRYKFRAGLNHYTPSKTANLMSDLKKDEYKELRQRIYNEAVTMLRNDNDVIPLDKGKKIAIVTIGNTKNDVNDALASRGVKATSFVVAKDNVAAKSAEWLKSLESYDLVVVNIEKTNMFAAKNYGINDETVDFFNRLVAQNDVVLNLFACPYALDMFRINNSVKGLLVAYQDEVPAVNAVADVMVGNLSAKGTLPISTAKFGCGEGIVSQLQDCSQSVKDEPASVRALGEVPFMTSPLKPRYVKKLDSVAQLGIKKGAYPGCQIVAMKDGKIIYDKCFGHFTYDGGHVVQPYDIYDIASCTKIFASTLAIMKLYDEGKVDLYETLADFFPYLKDTPHGKLKIIELMTHQSGLKAWIPFYKDIIDANGPKREFFSHEIDENHTVRVAENLFLVNNYEEKIFDSISKTALGKKKYLYSDFGFYYMPKLVKLLTNKDIESYLQQNFYIPMRLSYICYQPLHRFTRDQIAPTENDMVFRKQLVWGDVNDQAAAMMGGVAGHAGLFSNARDLACLMQMLIDGGVYQGRRYLKAETVSYFTTAPFTSNGNRRGIGFDKLPIGKEGATVASKSASMASFGHSGFTGTFCWADPENDLIFIFLSNRVYPETEPNKLVKYGLRTQLHDILYEAVSE